MNTGVAIAAGIGGAAIAATGGYLAWWYLRNGSLHNAVREMTNPILTIATAKALGFPEYWVRWDWQEVSFIDGRGAPEPFQWPRVVAQNGGRPLRYRIRAIPVGARALPYRLYQRSDTRGMCDAAVDPMTKAGRLTFLNRVREIASRTSLAFADPRILAVLLAQESNWDKSVHCRNPWNGKAQGKLYATNYADLVASRMVFTTLPRATGFYIIQDGTNSVDAYPMFDSFEDSFEFIGDAFRQPNYTNAIPALAQGERAGLIEFATSIGEVYSKTSKATYREWMGNTWDRCARMLGADWRR